MATRNYSIFGIRMLLVFMLLISTYASKADSISEPSKTRRATLFESTTKVLPVKIIADWPKVWADTGLYPSEHQGFLEFIEGEKAIKLSVKISLRGDFRLKGDHCSLKPIRLNFKKKEVVNTVWEGQDKLKIVLQCQSKGEEYKSAVLNEFIAYRILNRLTDVSYKVKLLEINLKGFDGSEFGSQIAGFALESDEELENRLSGQFIKVHNIHPNYVNLEQMLTIALFEFMIGNTDWSVKALHNIKLLGVVGGPPVPVAYDFDFSGIVNAPYAIPAPHLPISTVRERYYNGHCRPIEELEKQKKLFNDRHDLIIQELEILKAIDLNSYEFSKNYIDEFYDILNTGDLSESVFMKSCRND